MIIHGPVATIMAVIDDAMTFLSPLYILWHQNLDKGMKIMSVLFVNPSANFKYFRHPVFIFTTFLKNVTFYLDGYLLKVLCCYAWNCPIICVKIKATSGELQGVSFSSLNGLFWNHVCTNITVLCLGIKLNYEKKN